MDWSQNTSIATENFLKSLEEQTNKVEATEMSVHFPDPPTSPTEPHDEPQLTPEEAYDLMTKVAVTEAVFAEVEQHFGEATQGEAEASGSVPSEHGLLEPVDCWTELRELGESQRETRRTRWCSTCHDRVTKPHQCFSSAMGNSSEEH